MRAHSSHVYDARADFSVALLQTHMTDTVADVCTSEAQTMMGESLSIEVSKGIHRVSVCACLGRPAGCEYKIRRGVKYV